MEFYLSLFTHQFFLGRREFVEPIYCLISSVRRADKPQ